MSTIGSRTFAAALAAVAVCSVAQLAAAQDKVKVGVFPTASSVPYFAAIDRGWFWFGM